MHGAKKDKKKKDKKKKEQPGGAQDAHGGEDDRDHGAEAHGGEEHGAHDGGGQGGEQARGGGGGGGGGHAGQEAAPQERPAPISAKFIGVGRKIFRTPSRPGRPRPTSPGASPPPGGAAGAAPAATAPPLTAATAKTAIDGKAADVADLSAPFAADWVGKPKADLDAALTDVTILRHKVIDKFVSAGAPPAQTQAVGSKDPIAIQKFQDVDQEAHLAVPSLKGTFYTNLVAEMKKPDFTDRTRTYPAMKTAAPPGVFAGKGRPIPPDRISPLSSRNHSVDKLFDINIIAADIDAEIAKPLTDAGAPPAKVAEAKRDPERRKKAYRHILKGGRDPMTTIDKSKDISPYGTWYAPGQIVPKPGLAANTEFANMMTLGALQPEWYPSGTCILNIDRRISGAARDVKKPTCFDGMMSALWCARNMGADDYGLTGGGQGEFLEAKVPFSDVTSARAVIPDDDFLADIQRVVSEVNAATHGQSTPTEELLRGNTNNARILNTTVGNSGARDMYSAINNRSTQEQNSSGAAPNAPGAARPTSGAAPAGPAVAGGGAFDMRRGPRA